ncbi:MAG: class I SAM-dependent methyltransferase [Limnohabitans sp.]|nr:class I SAM-dependent methyltransferase [Limnohabitans sp.]
MQSIRRALSIFIFASFAVCWLQACSVLQPETYVPQRGQMGKDVMWLPTSDDLVLKMLDAAKVGPQDELVDLGAGDGKIPIAAARHFGARAWGIEYNKDLAALAQRNAQRAGVAERVRIVHGDIFKEDFSKATVVTMYLLEELNAQLRPTILAMKPGTRVLSNTFSMGDWEPDQVIRVSNGTGYFWTVPANVAGLWTLSGLDEKGNATLKLDQTFQRLGGTLTIQGKTQNLLGARMEGSALHFSFINADGLLKAVKVLVNGQVLSGEVTGPYGMVEMQPAPVKLEGRRP